MNELPLSPTTKRLLSAAKADVPSAAARAKMWAGVSGAVGGVAGATGITASSLLSGGLSATKVLSLGALFGGTLTVGIAAALLQIGAAPAPLPSSVLGGSHASASHVAPSQNVVPVVPAVTSIAAPTAPSADIRAVPAAVVVPPSASASATKHPSRTAKGAATHEDSLVREASLVTQARASLVRNDPKAALRAIRAARALPAHQLDPEELAVEEQALRSLGETDQANGIVVQLRLQYPESDLAR